MQEAFIVLEEMEVLSLGLLLEGIETNHINGPLGALRTSATLTATLRDILS